MSAACAENASGPSSEERSGDESGEDKVRCDSDGLKLTDWVSIFKSGDVLGGLFPTTWLRNDWTKLLYRSGLKSAGGTWMTDSPSAALEGSTYRACDWVCSYHNPPFMSGRGEEAITRKWNVSQREAILEKTWARDRFHGYRFQAAGLTGGSVRPFKEKYETFTHINGYFLTVGETVTPAGGDSVLPSVKKVTKHF